MPRRRASETGASLEAVSAAMIRVVTPLLTACGGFLLAVLWMDLIFDVQVLGYRDSGDELPEPVLASIAGYYHRATTTSRPMSLLIVVVMLILVGALGFQTVHGDDPAWFLAVSAAVRLGNRTDNPAGQTRLARSVCRDHLLCLGCVFVFVALWVARNTLVALL